MQEQSWLAYVTACKVAGHTEKGSQARCNAFQHIFSDFAALTVL